MYCDLHIHSHYSDGSYSPAKIVAVAKKKNLVVALTDHNTIDGLPEFIHAAMQYNVTVVPGIEITTEYNSQEIHLLGLFVPPRHYQELATVTNHYHQAKVESNLQLINNLAVDGYYIDYDCLKSTVPNGKINRAHIGAELTKLGYTDSITSAFKLLLNEEAGYYTPPSRLQLLDTIHYLRTLQTLPVLAHPLNSIDVVTLRNLLPKAIEAGLLGMEVIHTSYDENTIHISKQLANDFSLLPSGGSDFHGSNKPNIPLGAIDNAHAVPVSFYQTLAEKAKQI